jgi:hypothetical protein
MCWRSAIFLWAGVWALVNQAENNARALITSASGSYLYSLNINAFNSFRKMTGTGNDFSHVGLGSPNIANLVASELKNHTAYPEIESVR